MPRVPENEWGECLNPDSEEYTPSVSEIENDQRIKKAVSAELWDIEHELRHPQEDAYAGGKDKFRGTDPDELWDALSRIREDFLKKVVDPELRKELEQAVSKMERKVYVQYIPFIESRIHLFGWKASPLEKHRRHQIIDPEEIKSYFNQARAVLARSQLSDEEKIDFLSELDRIREKLDRYQREPTLFTFESIEEGLQKELEARRFMDVGHAWGADFGREGDRKALEHEGARDEERLRLDLLLAKAHSLPEIAGRMLAEDIRSRCEERAKSLLEYIENLKVESEAPREFLSIEAELKDLIRRRKDGLKVEVGEWEELNNRFSRASSGSYGVEIWKMVERIQGLMKKAWVMIEGRGEEVDEEFEWGVAVGVDWAWNLLGVERGASRAEIKKAYHRLCHQYHPDISRSEDAAEKMKRVNEAYELVTKMRGDDKSSS